MPQSLKLSILTPRLQLRPLVPSDASLLAAVDADTDVLRYIGRPIATSLQGYKEFIAQVRARYLSDETESPLYGFWVAEERNSGVALGWYLLRPALDYRFAKEAGFTAGQVEIGYRFHTAAWGKGYATEGAQELLQRALLQKETTAIVAVALATNQASIRVMEKLGLHFDREIALLGYDVHGVRYSLPKRIAEK
jgi:RimJ/RimL family protein N-acetyltransferase